MCFVVHSRISSLRNKVAKALSGVVSLFDQFHPSVLRLTVLGVVGCDGSKLSHPMGFKRAAAIPCFPDRVFTTASPRSMQPLHIVIEGTYVVRIADDVKLQLTVVFQELCHSPP